MRIARLVIAPAVILGLAAAGAVVVQPALLHWQLQRAADDPAELSRLRLEAIAEPARIAAEIDQAVAAGDAELAESFVALAAERGIAVAPERLSRSESRRALVLDRFAQLVAAGATTGDGGAPEPDASSRTLQP